MKENLIKYLNLCAQATKLQKEITDLETATETYNGAVEIAGNICPNTAIEENLLKGLYVLQLDIAKKRILLDKLNLEIHKLDLERLLQD